MREDSKSDAADSDEADEADSDEKGSATANDDKEEESMIKIEDASASGGSVDKSESDGAMPSLHGPSS